MDTPTEAPRVDLEPVLHLLDKDPTSYRAFGVYWWPLKRLLREQGYRRYYLGREDDPVARVRVARLDLDPPDLLRAAAHHHRVKCEHGERYDGGSTFPDEDAPYVLNDPDFGPAATIG